MSDTENTTYRHYPIQVGKDRIIVRGPNRTRAEFTTMAAARKFIRDLIALTEQEAIGGGATDDATSRTGLAGRIPAETGVSGTDASPCSVSASALTESDQGIEQGHVAETARRRVSTGEDEADLALIRNAQSSDSVSASTAEPCVTSHEATPSRQQTDGNQRSGSSNVAALNYLRGMT